MTEDMKVLLIGIVSIVILLALIFVLASIKSNLKKLEEENKQFINEDGDHVYYDRRVIEEKKKKKS
jgi:type II secretory pathway pseudopilin PulG